ARRALVAGGNQLEVADSLANLGMLAFFERDLVAARGYLEESVALARAGGESWSLLFALFHLGAAESADGAVGTAQTHLAEALALAEQLHDKVLQAYVLEAQAVWQVQRATALDSAARRAAQAEAARLFDEADALRREVHSPIPPQWGAY